MGELASAAELTQAGKWARMDSEEAELRQQLECSVSTASAGERQEMEARLLGLSEQRERRNTTYFQNEQAQDLGNLLKELGLIQYLYLVCGAYGTMEHLKEDVQRRGADAVAGTLMALPMTEAHAWKLLQAGLGVKGGPSARSRQGTGHEAAPGVAAGHVVDLTGSSNPGHTHESSLPHGSSGRGRGLGGASADTARTFGDPHNEADGGGKLGVGCEHSGGSERNSDDERRRGWLSHAERVRRLLAMHDELVESERLSAIQRRRRRKNRRKERAQRVKSCCKASSDEEDFLSSGLLTATHKLWTARLDGVGVSVRGRTRCNRSVSLPMNSTLTREHWHGVAMEFLQTRSEFWRTQQGHESNGGDDSDNNLHLYGDESPENTFLRAVEEALQATPLVGLESVDNEEQEQAEASRRTTRSGFRFLPAIK
eukprot:COSAG02_NODE_8361_length_2598_cov_3.164066_1_plen_427_part_00